MNFVLDMKEKVISGEELSKEETLELWQSEIEELGRAANEIRKVMCGDRFDICTIINAKSGRCSEDCKYCAQSSHYNTNCEEYPLLTGDEIIENAVSHGDRGILRYSLVTSGRCISEEELDSICKTVKIIRNNTPLKVCGSFGLLSKEQYKKLYKAGITRIHNNLETSKNYFKEMCSTHNFEDKIAVIHRAEEAGMSICSGGIFGIGESIEDRIDLAYSLKELRIKSVPMNLLNPVKGTPYQDNALVSPEEFRRIVAVYRFVLPDVFLRLAGGRGLLPDRGKSCFLSGANAAISGDMLTTSGISVETDLQMLRELGFII